MATLIVSDLSKLSTVLCMRFLVTSFGLDIGYNDSIDELCNVEFHMPCLKINMLAFKVVLYFFLDEKKLQKILLAFCHAYKKEPPCGRSLC